MPFNLRRSSQQDQSGNDPKPDHQVFQSFDQHSAQDGERPSKSQNTPLRIYKQSKLSSARRKLQALHQAVYKWLEPEKHTKEEMISQLVLEHFWLTEGNSSDQSAMRDQWNSSGRRLNDFIEDVTNNYIKNPTMRLVKMHGQEAEISENMTLKDIIDVFRRKEPRGTPRGENSGIPTETLEELSALTAHGEDNVTHSWEGAQGNGSITSKDDQVSSLPIILQGNSPEPEEGGPCQDNPGASTRVDLGTSVSQEQPLEGCSKIDILMEEEDGPMSTPPGTATPKPTSAHRHKKRKYRLRKRQKRSGTPPKSQKCQECPKTFTYPSQLEYHQRKHRRERPFVCPSCPKGFFMKSDLHVHQVIHISLKPFECTVCGKPFSHRSNLLAHERIHTGEKPFKCSLCGHSYRQSSTYHRHLRWHERPSGSIRKKTT